ncbi:MAG: MraY family glycosyltransferase [Bacteroidota bacterium]|nr:MraY family glycosyltransferase [Bacteroidota bacterium]
MTDTLYSILSNYSALFVISLIFSLLINGLFYKFSKTFGTRNTKQPIIRWSSTDKPSVGGISFYMVFLLSIIYYTIIIDPTQIFKNLKFIGIFSATTLGFLMGLADDAYNTRPMLKFFVQLSCGVILIVTGTYINLFSNLIVNYLITLFWVVGIMNSINMLDNMDAITTSVSIFIFLSAIFEIVITKNLSTLDLTILVGSIGALLGFLYYNWNPSKIFMGDTGSQFLGILLAALGIVFFWNQVDIYGKSFITKRFISTVIIFIIPIIDTTTVTINRIMKGRSPFIGGKDHTTHYLSYLGLSDKQVAYAYIILSVFSMFLMVLINYIEKWNYVYFSVFLIYFLIIFAFLFYVTHIEHINKKINR